MDNWQVVARTNMFGCNVVGYSNNLPAFDDQCNDPQALGWWAALYFVGFIIIGYSVLLNLFEAVIITSMDLLRVSLQEYHSITARVNQMKLKYSISDIIVDRMLEIFELIDDNDNGRLTVSSITGI